MSSRLHPVIAVVDRAGDHMVVWHVQTSPTTPAGVLSGAWILGEGEVDPDRLPDLLADAVVMPVGDTQVAAGERTSISDIAAGIAAAAAEVKRFAAAAKENNKALTLPRLDVPDTPDVEELAAAHRGEEIGRSAWANATAVAELVKAWHGLESQRRSRKYLQEEFGADVRPLPGV